MFISVDVCFWVLKCLQICRCRASGDKRSHRKVTFTVSSFDTLPFLVAISLSHLDTLLWIIGWVIYGIENGNCLTIWRTKELAEPPERDISLSFSQQAWVVITYTNIHQPTIPDICHFFYTHVFWGLKILHSKVRKFATKTASRQNSVNHHHSV